MSVTMENDKSAEEFSNGTTQSISINLNTLNAQPNNEPVKRKKAKQCLSKFNISKTNNSFTLALLFHTLAIIYIAAAISHWYTTGAHDIDWENGLGLLLIISSLYYGYKFLKFIIKYVKCDFAYLNQFTILQHTRSITLGIFFACFFVYIAIDTQNNRQRLLPIFGICSFIAAGYALSKHPSHVNWNTVVSGLALQIAIGLLTIRWSSGKYVIQVVGRLVDNFFSYAYIGAEVTYGEELIKVFAVFAFKVLSVIFFMCFVIEILFYYGIIQVVVLRLGWVLQKLLGTTPAESVNACASVFLGMTEAPIIIKPYLSTLTESELHAVMMGGFSTVAGTVFAAYTSFGIDASYIITAAIMSAPTALSFSKLIFPETEEPFTKNQEITAPSIEKNGCNVVDAACRGAQFAVQMVSAIIANIIAFVSFVAFINALLSWLGILVGFEEFNFEYILGKTLIPIAWVLGTEFDECETVAKLIGLKITTNEFIAYKKLGSLKTEHKLSPKSEIIATFALCSFANPGSMGSMIATLTTLAPSQQTSIVKNIFRAFVGGTVTTLLTAAIASLLMT
ncbi:sodium/nucleoside cotransporter 2-like [Daktulosphaira vitifoliae]|uniref:sodium/nucleoside cotransporter 2-like n=1 Tax=Daktulosphaira vitifoliae TaxID=58002 RepID=UPI0021AA37D9|nr:sodium/nucleoside cotransporter 2-like [Daktulosphaira vitifoliae]XP_050534671.1 sodium/nucleoside cotransporter 2-like [Daktulosphaira vitifoliae]XP_050534672.1 sodium/nucleoside cotransporter 2-like [Daktulosphaira vitifoliae]XP_050534673.1 sodium/nucleoside cotransporter 2-like [Daktulosphaira vitifoliae]